MQCQAVPWIVAFMSVMASTTCTPPDPVDTDTDAVALITGKTPVEFDVGVDTGPAEETIGRIRAIEMDGEGRIVVLDDMARLVRLVAADGSVVGTAGGIGRGPGEFIGLLGIGTGPNGAIAVVDGPQRRMTLGRLQREGVILDEVVRTRIFAFDVCLMDSLFVLNDPVEQGLLHLVDSTGVLLHSWGELVVESTPRDDQVRVGQVTVAEQGPAHL